MRIVLTGKRSFSFGRLFEPLRSPSENPSQAGQPVTQFYALAGNRQFAKRLFMVRHSFLEHAECLADFPLQLHVTKNDDRIYEIADTHLGDLEVAGNRLYLVDE